MGVSWRLVAGILSAMVVATGGFVGLDGLFASLFQLSGVSYTHSGDSVCDPVCEAYINVTTTYWNFGFEYPNPDQMIYREVGSNTTLQRVRIGDYPDTVVYKKSTRGRKLWVDLGKVDNIVKTEPKVAVEWLVPARGKDNWRPIQSGDEWLRGSNNRIKLVSNDVGRGEVVKWTFETDRYVEIDPLWIGGENSFNIIYENGTGGEINQGLTFQVSNFSAVEKVNLSFSIEDSSNITGDITVYYTANGTNACATGNKQDARCFSYPQFITVKNGTDLEYFNDVGRVGDKFVCTYTGNRTFRNYSCEIDEHYNPNVFKHYDALFNFSVVKFQDGVNQRIHRDNYIKVNLSDTIIPNDADWYKLDFRVNYTRDNRIPQSPLNAYFCNSSYSVGTPVGNSNCEFIAGKLPSEFQDDGTKWRQVFTKDILTNPGDIHWAILLSAENNPNRYYSLKTINITSPQHGSQWNYSTDAGATWTNLGDGFETELNVNWFYTTGSNITRTVFIIEAENASGRYNSTEYIMSVSGTVNIAPENVILFPPEASRINLTTNVTWEVSDANSDGTWSNLTLSNATNATVFAVYNLSNTTLSQIINTELYADGPYNLTLGTCENATTEKYCDTHVHALEIVNRILSVYVWNSLTWLYTIQETFLNVIRFTCPVNLVDCEPTYINVSRDLNTSGQNSTILINQSILLLNSTGNKSIPYADFRINDTCAGVNLTFANSSKVKTLLDTTWRGVSGNLSPGLTESLYLFVNISNTTLNCPDIRTEFRVI